MLEHKSSNELLNSRLRTFQFRFHHSLQPSVFWQLKLWLQSCYFASILITLNADWILITLNADWILITLNADWILITFNADCVLSPVVYFQCNSIPTSITQAFGPFPFFHFSRLDVYSASLVNFLASSRWSGTAQIPVYFCSIPASCTEMLV